MRWEIDVKGSPNGSCFRLASAGIQLAGCPRGSAAELEFLRQQEDQLPYKLAYQAGSGDGPTTPVIWGWELWHRHMIGINIHYQTILGYPWCRGFDSWAISDGIKGDITWFNIKGNLLGWSWLLFGFILEEEWDDCRSRVVLDTSPRCWRKWSSTRFVQFQPENWMWWCLRRPKTCRRCAGKDQPKVVTPADELSTCQLRWKTGSRQNGWERQWKLNK